jgi:hypothetical protein
MSPTYHLKKETDPIFRNVVFSSFQNSVRWVKSMKPAILSVVIVRTGSNPAIRTCPFPVLLFTVLKALSPVRPSVVDKFPIFFFFVRKTPIYLQSVIIHSANGGKGEGCLVEEYSVALLC